MNTVVSLAMVDSLLGAWRQPKPAANPAGLLVTREERRGAAIIRIEGRLLLEYVDQSRQPLHTAFRTDAPRLIVDLTACSMADIAGVALLIASMQRARQAGRGFVLAGLGPQVRDVLALSHLEKAFTSLDTVEAALAA